MWFFLLRAVCRDPVILPQKEKWFRKEESHIEKADETKKVEVLTKEKRDLAGLIRVREAPHAIAGQSVRRTDDPLKVSGKLKYGADYTKGGFLHGKILRSPHPHALIKKIDASKALALEGVVTVLTADDVPGRNGFGAILPDQPVICKEKVRFIGDGVALVAAETEKIAQKALALIEVTYELLPAVFDPRDALKKNAPAIHEKGNLLSFDKLRKGDTEKGFAEAEVILERIYQVPFLEHAYLEPDIAMAAIQPDGTMLVEGPMQAPFTVRRNVAAVLGLPVNRVRARQIHMGGGFGGKEDSPIDLCCRAAVLSIRTGKPVCISLEREEVTLQTCKRHPMIMEVKIGAKKDGTLTGFEGVLYDEQGAYASLGPKIPPAGGSHVHSMVMMPGPYEIPNVKVDAYLCYTNHPYGGAMRGFGAPQVHIAHEQLMDELAAELGMDPVNIRRKNAFKLGSQTATGQVLDQSVGLQETLEACAKEFEWDRRKTGVGYIDPQKTKRRGIGVAMGWYRTSIGIAGDGCGANIYVHEDGSVLLYSGITEMGQGAFTVLPQICAEALGVRIEDVRLVTPDTDLVPESGPTVGSRSTTLDGKCHHTSGQSGKRVPVRHGRPAAVHPQRADRIPGSAGIRPGNPQKSRSFQRSGSKVHDGRPASDRPGVVGPSKIDPRSGNRSGQSIFRLHVFHAYGAGGGGRGTGEVDLEDYVAAFDVGKAINPRALEGQIEGGVAMGLGYALMEEVVIEKGMIQNLTLQNYLIPTTLDVPDIRPIIIEETNKYGPFGAKGIGEMPNIPATPAILNAIADACGGRVRKLPAHPEAVFWAIREAGGPLAE